MQLYFEITWMRKVENNKLIKNKKVRGNIIGISEEKDVSKVKLLLQDTDIELNTRKHEYELGDTIKMELDIEVRKLQVISKSKKY